MGEQTNKLAASASLYADSAPATRPPSSGGRVAAASPPSPSDDLDAPSPHVQPSATAVDDSGREEDDDGTPNPALLLRQLSLVQSHEPLHKWCAQLY